MWTKNVSALCRLFRIDRSCLQARMALALHILRLRPDLDTLRKYNNGVQLHTKQLKAERWTEFLESLTHSTIFDALEKKPEPEAKLKLRQKILRQIYFVAKAEEEYLKGERGECLCPIFMQYLT